MNNNPWKFVGFGVIGLILLILSTIILKWISAFLDWARFDAGDLATWVGAVGSLLAFAGTIGLATRETRRRERTETVLASLHASALLLRIDEAYNSIANLRVQIQHDIDEGGVRARMLEYALDTIKGLRLWTVDDLIPLAPLPDSVASKLAQIPDQVVGMTEILAEATIEFPSDLLRAKRELMWMMAGANGEATGSEENYYRLEAGRDLVRILRASEAYLRDSLDVCRVYSAMDTQPPVPLL